MENASKALIIAGAILISVLIISLSIMVFNNFSGSAKQMANMDKEEIAAFNSKITPYVGKNVSGSQVNALIQYIISLDTSAASSGDTHKAVKISFPTTSGKNEVSVSGTTVKYSNTLAPKRVETGSSAYYAVKADYSKDTGLINVITITKN